jgi:hypothetical protein
VGQAKRGPTKDREKRMVGPRFACPTLPQIEKLIRPAAGEHPNPARQAGSTEFLLRKERVGRIVAFRSAKVAWIHRCFRGAKGDRRLSATETTDLAE